MSMESDCLHNLLPTFNNRIQGGHGFLEHGADVAPAHVAPAPFVEGEQVAAGEADRARQHLDPARQEPDGGQRRNGNHHGRARGSHGA